VHAGRGRVISTGKTSALWIGQPDALESPIEGGRRYLGGSDRRMGGWTSPLW
jgi:hypothetical protein